MDTSMPGIHYGLSLVLKSVWVPIVAYKLLRAVSFDHELR